MTAVSVILVSYNTSELTRQCLRRLAETTVDHEVIVVDNASPDGSAMAVATEFPSVRLLALAENVGFAVAVNAAAAVAGGRWLLLINPDTEPDGDVIARLTEYAGAHPDRGIYTGRTLNPDGTDDGLSCHPLPSLWGLFCFATGLSTVARRSTWFNPDELPGLDRTAPAVVPAVSGCLLLIDRGLFDALGGFAPEYFMYSEDIDLCARAAALGARPTLVPAARVIHARGASSSGAGKRVMLLRGRTTYFRRRWPTRRAAIGRALLVMGVALRAAGARLTGRAVYWREVWARREMWLPGWPQAPSEPREQAPAVHRATP